MKLVFAGTPEIAAQALREIASKHEVVLAITMPDATVGRSKELLASPVAQAATELGIPVLKTKRLDSEAVAAVAEAGAELAVVIAYGAMIPPAALNLFPWLNIHFSLLPQWRGASPLQQSVLTGEGQGFTIFKLDESMDTGPILLQESIQLDPDRTTGEHLAELTGTATTALLQRLSSPLEFQPQVGEPSYAPKIDRAAARIDFLNPADDVHRLVMAMNPEPMAWCEHNSQPMRVLSSRSLGSTDWDTISGTALRPGQVELSQSRVLVACGQGTRLELVEVQPAGKRAMTAIDWYRGQQSGIQLG